MLVYILKLTE